MPGLEGLLASVKAQNEEERAQAEADTYWDEVYLQRESGAAVRRLKQIANQPAAGTVDLRDVPMIGGTPQTFEEFSDTIYHKAQAAQHRRG